MPSENKGDARGSSSASSTLASRLGLPAMQGRGLVAAALIIDSLGSGLFIPFLFVYFVQTTTLGVVKVGLALSIAGLVALPGGLLSGPVIDRIGPKAVMLAGHALRCVVFLIMLSAQSFLAVVILVALISVGDTSFWAANNALIKRIARNDMSRWFGMERSIRNAGAMLGGILAAAILSIGGGPGLDAILIVNAASFIVAGCLLAAFRWPAEKRASSSVGGSSPSGFGAVLRDADFCLLVAVTTYIGLTDFVLIIVLPTQLSANQGTAWLAGVLISINAIMVTIFQPWFSRIFEKASRPRVLQFGAMLYIVAFAAFTTTAWLPGVWIAIVAISSTAIFTTAELVQSPAGYALAASMAPDELSGRYMAVYQSAWSAAAVVAPALFGWLISVDRTAPWLAMIVGAVAVVGASQFLNQRVPAAHRLADGTHLTAEPL